MIPDPVDLHSSLQFVVLIAVGVFVLLALILTAAGKMEAS